MSGKTSYTFGSVLTFKFKYWHPFLATIIDSCIVVIMCNIILSEITDSSLVAS